MNARTFKRATLAAVLSGIAIAPVASAATTVEVGQASGKTYTITTSSVQTYYHVTSGSASSASSVTAENAAIASLKKAGAVDVSVQKPQLTASGWSSTTSYVATKPLMSGDAQNILSYNQVTGTHAITGFKTKTDAQAHLAWAEAQLKKMNNKQLLSGSVTAAKGGKFNYSVSYLTTNASGAAFGGDTLSYI